MRSIDLLVKPSDVSQVVNANGEPRVVYHGTESDFEAFDSTTIGSRTDDGHLGAGFYFATDTAVSNSEPLVIHVFLSIRNPLHVVMRLSGRISEFWCETRYAYRATRRLTR